MHYTCDLVAPGNGCEREPGLYRAAALSAIVLCLVIIARFAASRNPDIAELIDLCALILPMHSAADYDLAFGKE